MSVSDNTKHAAHLAQRAINALVQQIALEIGWIPGEPNQPYAAVITAELGVDIRVLQNELVPFFQRHPFKPHQFAEWREADAALNEGGVE